MNIFNLIISCQVHREEEKRQVACSSGCDLPRGESNSRPSWVQEVIEGRKFERLLSHLGVLARVGSSAVCNFLDVFTFADAWIETLQHYSDWFKKQNNVKADNSKRLNREDSKLGDVPLEGSFRQISFD